MPQTPLFTTGNYLVHLFGAAPFASGQASPESDDSDEELDETDKSLAQPDGPESDDMDLDGSDGDY